MYSFFQKLVDIGFALVYIDDILLLAHTKTHLLDLIEQLQTPTSKTELKRFIGSMNFYSQFINNLHISLKPFYTLLHDGISFKWTPELDKLFNDIKNSLTKDAELVIPNTTHPLYFTVDDSLIGLGEIIFQPNTENKMQVKWHFLSF